ncbi:hypothetical protein [Allobaculum sp. Allo2]|uniref:hypothetical protein n=1 Tax=Allobaculum sp. Allo2 TaxID=2853432 RepID=UPI001F614D0A|nr:hypothetical protein [Allobaculum sp. Allo2]UNT94327.1 hypothetical protein KWG61_06990 [Allobaculum sp. Allo2]
MPRKAKAAPTLQEQIASTIVKEYKPKTFKEASDLIREIFGPVLEQMLQGELDSHLGYTSGSHVFVVYNWSKKRKSDLKTGPPDLYRTP